MKLQAYERVRACPSVVETAAKGNVELTPTSFSSLTNSYSGPSRCRTASVRTASQCLYRRVTSWCFVAKKKVPDDEVESLVGV